MTKEEFDKKLELELALSRAAIERADAFIRKFDRLAATHNASTDQLLRKLRHATRHR